VHPHSCKLDDKTFTSADESLECPRICISCQTHFRKSVKILLEHHAGLYFLLEAKG
jgi:hypothetical protein